MKHQLLLTPLSVQIYYIFSARVFMQKGHSLAQHIVSLTDPNNLKFRGGIGLSE